jgi:tetratricopeptide (TPR) repeat protein
LHLCDIGRAQELNHHCPALSLQHYRMALAAIEKQLGPDDPEQVAYIANLAGVLQEKEQHSEAQALLERALQLCKRTLGTQVSIT